MIPLSAAEIAGITGGELHNIAPEAIIDGTVVTDSRLASSGSIFVAIPGERADGHDYVTTATHRGAALSLVSRPVAGPHVVVPDTVAALGDLARAVLKRLRETGDIRVVGVTGSVGKTTTKDLLAHVLGRFGATVAPRASFNNEIGLPLTVLEATAHTRYLVLEMGASGRGHIDYLTAIAPLDVAVVLVVGQAHLEGFGTLEDVAEAKAEIVAGLLPAGTAVLNADDDRVAAMAAEAAGPVVTFGREAGADLRARDVTLDDEARARFTLEVRTNGADGRDAYPVTLAVRGEHQVFNSLAVCGAAFAMGLDLAQVSRGLAEASIVSPHRMALRPGPHGAVLLDDAYNANPDSVAAALRALARMPGDRHIAVLGDMLELGEAAESHHRHIGRLAGERAGLVIGVGRYGEHVAGAARHAGARAAALADVAEAAAQLSAQLREGDVVLLKGSNGSGIWQLADRLAAEGATDQP
ncbi:MAG TPA: UDP-N-acetylmuramoyl-tripeptide--D-alanyl-D-alanine ligase [Actinomycetaceae bacterium]|nr:UDP-N-acetylmuramoyl-tripeptide--D-alanyl-D-alanine ligase [Actinomycetaceae bacterium]